MMSTIEGTDENVRSACVWVLSKKGQTKIIQQTIQGLYPLEVGTTDEELNNSADCTPDLMQKETPHGPTTDNDTSQSHRSAAVKARDMIIACFTD